VTVQEGERANSRTVLIKVPFEEAATTWWNSPEYQEIAAFRRAGTTAHSIILVHPIPQR
jgi:uncharacterized protein (DUF1330 family)